MTKSTEVRNDLRTKLIGTKHAPERTIVKLFGVEIELQQPTLASMLEARQEDDERTRTADMFIRYAFVPGTDERVFEDGDRDTILNWPYTKEILSIQTTIMKLTGIDIADAEALLKGDPLGESS